MENKKAQIKIQQMIFMLIAVTLFFILVLMFFLVIKFSGLKENAQELEEKNALLLVSKLANSPEFSCEESFGKNKINCVDADKIIMLKENIEKYNDFWGVKNIEIRKIYPNNLPKKVCSILNYPFCNLIRIRPNTIGGFDYSSFVTLCRKENFNGEIYNKCEIAKMIISYN
jgi:hypothetical protein